MTALAHVGPYELESKLSNRKPAKLSVRAMAWLPY
jgi:hypothetical protein